MINRIAQYDTLRIASERAIDLMMKGECTAAVQLWDDFLENDPDCAQAYFERGRARALEGRDPVGMLNDYRTASEMEPENRGFRFVYHLTLGGAIQSEARGADRQQITAAIHHYNIAIETAEDYADAFTYRGTAFMQIDEIDLAHQDFTKAIKLDRGNALAYLMRGTIAFDAGRLAQAKADLESAQTHRDGLSPDYFTILDELLTDVVAHRVDK